MIDVKHTHNNTYHITWDKHDKQEKILNDWTEKDFKDAIQNKLNSIQKFGEVDNATKAIQEINDYLTNQIKEEQKRKTTSNQYN